jgi:hypothetical protein
MNMMCSFALPIPLPLVVATILVVQSLPAPAPSNNETSFSERVSAADPGKYASIRDAKCWANPYLIVSADRVNVLSETIESGRKSVAVRDLRELLMGLPITAWPYGRVVAVQPQGLSGRVDRTPIAQSMQRVRAILEQLPVVIDPWPP